MKKTKLILRILRETILILLIFIIASGIGYQCSKTPEQHENDLKAIRTILFSKGIYLNYKLPEKETDNPVLWDSAGQEINQEKKVKISCVDFMYMNLNQAIKMSDKIFRGKVLNRSTQTKGSPIYKADGSIYAYDYYREVTVEVIDMIKGKKSQKTILYKEPGGETEDYIHKWDCSDFLTIGEEYIFFLYENNTFLNPATVMSISDDLVLVDDIMCPEDLQVEGERTFAQRISVDTYVKAIKKVHLGIEFIRVLIIILIIGISLIICYFIGRNLYKTTMYILKFVRK